MTLTELPGSKKGPAAASAKDAKDEKDIINEEDRQLIESIQLIMERLVEMPSAGNSSAAHDIKKTALENLKNLLRSATSSMTSVPKPMKHLFKYLGLLRQLFAQEAILQSDIDTLVFSKPAPKKLDNPATDMAIEAPVVHVPLDLTCRALCADILSVMSMAYGQEKHQEALHYKILCDEAFLKAGLPAQDVSYWGHEYVRHISMEIMDETFLTQELVSRPDTLTRPLISGDILKKLAIAILPFFIQHNAEADAVDLSLELDLLDPHLFNLMDSENYTRMTLYLSQFCAFEEDPVFRGKILSFLGRVFDRLGDINKAFLTALKMNQMERVYEIFVACSDPLKRLQLCFIMARSRLNVLPDQVEAALPIAEVDTIKRILSNDWLSTEFQALAATEFNVGPPKFPEDMYKSHLVESPFGRFGGLMGSGFGGSSGGETWKNHLADAFVNGLLNMGHAKEKFLFVEDSENPGSYNGAAELYKNKEGRLAAAVASLGLVHLWNLEGGVALLDPYLSSTDPYIQSGGLLALGLVACGVRDEAEPAFALLMETIESDSMDDSPHRKLHALLALGIAYAGTRHPQVREVLLQYLHAPEESSTDSSSSSLLMPCVAAMACGLVFCGSQDGELQSAFLQFFMEVPTSLFHANRPLLRLVMMSFGLLFLGVEDTETQRPIETILETLDILEDANLKLTLKFLVRMMSGVGSGNVLFVQECLKMLGLGSKAFQDEDKTKSAAEKAARTGGKAESKSSSTDADADPASAVKDSLMADAVDETERLDAYLFAIFGLVLMPLGEELSSDMTMRLLQHCLAYLPPSLRCLAPLALSLLHASYPSAQLIDTLSKHSHDPDPKLAQLSILGLGLIGLGTNQAKISSLLRDLWKYYSKESSSSNSHLFYIRLAYGLLSASKGLVSGSLLYCGRSLLDKTALASYLLFFTALLEDPSWWLDAFPSLFYILAPVFSPRILATLAPTDAGSLFRDASSQTSVDMTAPASEGDAKKTVAAPSPVFNHRAVNARVGHPMDVVGQAGRPKTITGFQTHATPVLLAFDERAELATEAYHSLADILEGFVVLVKNPDAMELMEE